MTQYKTAVFGSAFNPPHMGHADVINQALEVFERVILVPSFVHAFGKTMAPFDLRLAMTNVLTKHHTDWLQRVTVSDIEKAIADRKPANSPIYTYDVLVELESLHPNDSLTFAVGPDNANPQTWAKFYNASEIDKRWGHWEAKEQKKIRSTDIREILQSGRQANVNDCPPEIGTMYRQYIELSKKV